MTWAEQHLPADHPPVESGRIGVLLVNLGTPDAPDTKSVKRYLAEFLSDRRVVEIPPIAWQPILRGIILNTRPKKSARAYKKVWGEDGSPLAAITKRQAMAHPGASGRRRDGRLGHAVRQSVDRHEAARNDGCWLRTHPARAAISAIFRRNDGNGRRQGRRHAGRSALADEPQDLAALPRSSGVSGRAGSGSRRAAWMLSISTRRSCCSVSTACRSARWNWAIRIIVTATRPPGCFRTGLRGAKGWRACGS